MSNVGLALYGAQRNLQDKSIQRIDAALLRYDAWFMVLLAVLLALAVVVTLGMAVWCVVNQKGKWTGRWSLVRWGTMSNFECAP